MNVLEAIDVCFDVKEDGPFRFSLVGQIGELFEEARIVVDDLGRSPDFDPGLAGIIHNKQESSVVFGRIPDGEPARKD
ncbi:hypothetical protein FBQ96_02235 [Nitrospirales bacterium NOB]|nr:hypothetical protein [Nitrospirales bacterium NOB]